MKTKIFTLILALAANMGTMLANFETTINGIRYELNLWDYIAKVASNSDAAGSVNIPSYVEYNAATCCVEGILTWAFYNCKSLISIVIPNNVEYIGDEAFFGCSGLTSITCEAVTPPTLGYNVFYEVDKSIPLYVPKESITKYKAANQWKNFNNIYAIGDDDPQEVDEINENQKQSSKLIRNGSVYILTDDSRTYTLTGQQIR